MITKNLLNLNFKTFVIGIHINCLEKSRGFHFFFHIFKEGKVYYNFLDF